MSWTFGEPIPKEILDRSNLRQFNRSEPGVTPKGKKSYAKKYRRNPCLTMYGAGPEGKTCKDCVHLIGHGRGRCYYKCKLRGISNGPATDHYVSWEACGKYEKEGK